MMRSMPPYQVEQWLADDHIMRERNPRPELAERNRAIVAEREAGASLRAIGKRYNLTGAMIRIIVVQSAIIAEQSRRAAMGEKIIRTPRGPHR